MVGYAQNLIVDHNEVNDGSYTGISVGWGWGAVTDMQNYQIRNNKVTNIIENHLYDGAGLYVLGTFQTTEKTESAEIILKADTAMQVCILTKNQIIFLPRTTL